MITVNNVDFKYRGSRRDVLMNISITLEENRICGLLGKNGIGKSTLLYLIAGLLRPTNGEVLIDGKVTAEGDPDMLKEIFLVSEEFSLPAVAMDDYIRMHAQFYPRFSKELLDDCLREFEIPVDAKLSELSMGQKKKVFMSFALASNTRVLLMDEPTNGLDIPSKAQFRKVVSRCMQDDRIIIISTHQVHDVNQLLDHVIILAEDGVLLNETVDAITSKYVFETRMPQDMDDAIYAEPSLQGNIVMAPRGDRQETPINLELLFNAFTSNNLEF